MLAPASCEEAFDCGEVADDVEVGRAHRRSGPRTERQRLVVGAAEREQLGEAAEGARIETAVAERGEFLGAGAKGRLSGIRVSCPKLDKRRSLEPRPLSLAASRRRE